MSISADDGLTLLVRPAAGRTPDADSHVLLAIWQAAPTTARDAAHVDESND